jgi:RND family efflux transporter MFP subunit
VYVKLGDRIRANAPLATVSSPHIAELHAKLHETQAHLRIAERNLERVLRSENRVAVLQARAKLDEAQATLNRTRRLIDLGAGAGKDIVAAEAAYSIAKAEFDFQSNISLNKELQEARAEVETTREDIAHIKDQMRAYGASDAEIEGEDKNQNTALITLRAPSAGTVSERAVNPGSGFEAGKPLFTIANLSGVWVVANVPEGSVRNLHVGTPAEVRSSALGDRVLAGHVSYISPQLDETTRTAHVRIDVSNPGEMLKVGMFAEVGFQTTVAGTKEPAVDELVIPTEAVQSIGDRNIVFIPKEREPGHFLVRDVELGIESEGYRKVISGLTFNDRVVTRGSFTLKTRLLRGELEEE